MPSPGRILGLRHDSWHSESPVMEATLRNISLFSVLVLCAVKKFFSFYFSLWLLSPLEV